MNDFVVNFPITIHTEPDVEPLPLPGLPIEREYADEADEDTPDIGYAGGASYAGAAGAPVSNSVRPLLIPEINYAKDNVKRELKRANAAKSNAVKPLAIPEMQFTCD